MDKKQQLNELNKRLKAKFKNGVLLYGKGNLNAAIMLVSEFPDEEELRRDRPLSGTRGKIFDQLLKKLGLTRQKVYITHAVKAGKKPGEFPHPKEIKQFSHFLREEIKILEPKLIVALGNVALRGLNVKLPLLNIRGRLIRFGVNSLFATHHPSAIQTNPELQTELEKDTKRLVEAITNLI